MTNSSSPWYKINAIEQLDTPVLVVYVDRVKENIQLLLKSVDDVDRLRPHVKTHKTREVTQLMLDAGITKFKCATIAEAEMLGMCGCEDVLLAYQPVGPKLERFIQLIQKYPATSFSCLIDNLESAFQINLSAKSHQLEIAVFLDINVGMNRTGIQPSIKAENLAMEVHKFPNVKLKGLHAYDGQTQDFAIAERTAICWSIYEDTNRLKQTLKEKGINGLRLVMGGSPSFPIYAKLKDVECSPGTFVFWDQSYLEKLPEQNFIPAALVVGRVVSMPTKDRICLDIGHKSIASENGLADRIKFLNAPEVKVIGHSEEHMMLAVREDHNYNIGDVFYGLPFHICPTCALFESATVIENGNVTESWDIFARSRKLTI